MGKKLDVNVYLDAATMCAEGIEKYSCYAVDLAAGYDPNTQASDEATAYYQTFCPYRNTLWHKEIVGGYWNKRMAGKYQLQRSLALLFMAEMVADNAL